MHAMRLGIEATEKANISARISHHLLHKLVFDMTAVTVEEDLGGVWATIWRMAGAAGTRNVRTTVQCRAVCMTVQCRAVRPSLSRNCSY